MTYATEHVYLTFGGTLVQDEIWQCGIRFASQPPMIPLPGDDDWRTIDQFELNAIGIADIAEDLRTWFLSGDPVGSSGSGINHSPCTLDWVKLAAKDVAGLDKLEPRTYLYESAVTAPLGVGAHPPQITYVVTLWSGQQTGRANYGRFYVPSPATSPNHYINGRLSETWVAGLRTAACVMLEAVTGEMTTAGQSLVPMIMSKVGTGQNKPIKQVGVGRVLDTQRRRRGALDETILYAEIS